MIAILDYGVGNLYSLKSSLEAVGAKTIVTGDPTIIGDADKIILPGVGAFADAVGQLRDTGMDEIIHREVHAGKPLLGVCLGMQLLLDVSYEYGEHKGLGLIPGEVRPLADFIPEDFKIPHTGWNQLHVFKEKHPLFRYLRKSDCVYFVHSYCAVSCAPCVIATTSYGATVTAAVAKDHVMGCQFHPEKSGNVGLHILKAFCEWGEKT
ncbi:MAG TPA: imidazole glycerol phosphate synthase subunit HisH [Clostridiales bacterium]|nr:imidazole glycerol phosphate synthase subunit HisH [Clostridiales bacterium]HBE13527.1 imidazole glycerol phosphate synthase subunit HisH [Clostridiales bacterium]HCG36140.1 imidazole glycerol phosphate synthase subunit HisH [Clostridiales bacterium]